MTLKVDAPHWRRSYDPIHSKGLVPTPPVGTKLGILQVMVRPEEDDDTFEFRTVQFTGGVSFFKHVFHRASPRYDFYTTRAFVNDIPESEVPAEVLEAFEQEIEESRW